MLLLDPGWWWYAWYLCIAWDKRETGTNFAGIFSWKFFHVLMDAISGQKITWNLAISETMLFLKTQLYHAIESLMIKKEIKF